MIHAIAIDDEPVALDIIRMHAAGVPFLELRRDFTKAHDALDYLTSEKVDLIFLDIQMPVLDGIAFARQIDPAIKIVFTTAYSQYAVTGFDMAITDFLLKPINYDRFLQACHMAQTDLAQSENRAERNTLFVKDGYKLVRIDLEDLLYIKAEDNYVNLIRKNGQNLCRITLTEIIRQLPDDKFFRTHKSFAVNVDKIERLENKGLLIDGKMIPVSKFYLKELKVRLGG